MAKVVSKSKSKPKRAKPPAAHPVVTSLVGKCNGCQHQLRVNLATPSWAEFFELSAFCKDCQLMFAMKAGVS